MHKDDVKLGIFLVVFMVVALVNSIYLWLPWEHKYGNKA